MTFAKDLDEAIFKVSNIGQSATEDIGRKADIELRVGGRKYEIYCAEDRLTLVKDGLVESIIEEDSEVKDKLLSILSEELLKWQTTSS
jgi:hypothetical protein